MGFYKNAAMDMRILRMSVDMENVPRLTARRAAVTKPPSNPVRRIPIMTDKPRHNRDEKAHDPKEARGKAFVQPQTKPEQDPDKQPSSRGGGGLKPTNAPCILLHRRGKAGTNMLADFKDEIDARAYATQHKLLIVHSETVEGQVRLFYLPE